MANSIRRQVRLAMMDPFKREDKLRHTRAFTVPRGSYLGPKPKARHRYIRLDAITRIKVAVKLRRGAK